MSIVAYNNQFDDGRAQRTVLTDVGGTFSAALPIKNVLRKQLPLFAQFVETCELDLASVDDASAVSPNPISFSAAVFAVLGHTLHNGMTVEFIDGATSLGVVTVANYTGLPNHAILALGTAVSLDTLTVKITGGVSGAAYHIGAIWAGPAFRTGFSAGDFVISPRSLSAQAWAAATGYTNRQPSQQMISARFPGIKRADAIGPAWPNWNAITLTTGKHDPMILIPDEAELAHSVYGLVESFADTRPQPSPRVSVWRGGVDLIEMR